MATREEALTLFLSYASVDEYLLRELEAHLSLLKRQKVLSTWYNRLIVPGTNVLEVSLAKLEQAVIILLLVSPDFLASDYCYNIEMQHALRRHQAGEAHVIPVILRPWAWQYAPFASLLCLPRDGKPITEWMNRDSAWNKVEQGIRNLITNSSEPTVNSIVDAVPIEEKENATQEKQTKQLPFLGPRRRASFSSPFPDIWNVPRRHTPFFTGRDQILQQLADGFLLDNKVAMVQHQAITGLGGMGKTQTAAEYAYLYRSDYQAVFWVRAETQETLVADFQTIASLLKIPRKQINSRTRLLQSVHKWLKNEVIARSDPAATELLDFVTFLSPDAIPEKLLIDGGPYLDSKLSEIVADPFALNATVSTLLAYSLVRRDADRMEESNILGIHRLVQTVLQDNMDSQKRQQWIQKTVQVVGKTFPIVQFKVWQLCDLWLSHAEICMNYINEEHILSQEAAQLLGQAGFYMQKRGRFAEAETPLQSALTIREALLGRDHLEVTRNLNTLAFL